MTPREARPRSERLRALGIHGSTVPGSASSDYLALKAAFSSHAADSDIHVTAEEKAAWDLVASLFGVDDNGDIYPKDNRGFWTNSFLSARGADAEAGGGGGLDVTAMWAALAAGTSEQINASHIPELSISKISGLQDALDSKLSAITGDMVESVLTGTVTSHNHDGMYAPLSGGVIPSQYLPSYVDDVLEYTSKSAFPSSGEAGKIYVALDTNLTYRWGGSSYVEISPSLALGYTSSTAYPGNEGAANASAIATLRGYFTGGAANKVAYALTISYDGGTAVKFDGSTALSVTIPSDAQRARWDKICALFDVDDNGDVHVTGNRGFWSPTFLSSRGSDPEAGQGGTGGLDIDAMWDALATSGAQKIDASHIPALGLLSGTVSNAQLANSSITVAGVEVPLGSAVTAAQIATALTTAGYKLTDTTYGLATDTVAGLVKIGYLTQVGTKNYGVKLNSLGQMYVSVPWTDTVTTLASLGITATAAELNFVDGVTSNIQTQLNAKANASALSAYLPLAGGVMTGDIEMSGAGRNSLYIRMYADTSNYRTGIGWKTVSGGTLLSQIGYWNSEQRIYINSRTNEISDVWQDTVGKYSLVVGKNLLTYNTYPLLHSGNYTSYTVTKTGGGASGTWGINISGNASAAGALTNNSTTEVSNRLRYHQISNDLSSVGSTAVGGAWVTPPTSQDSIYGNGQILRLGWAQEYYTDIFTGPNGMGSNYGIQFRQVVSSVAQGWRILLDTSNYAKLISNVASATKLATARTLWGQSFNGENNVSGDMIGVGRINNGLIISQFGTSADNSDTTRFLINGHRLEFGGYGYAHQGYYFRPQYSARGATYADMYIQNASAADSPVFSTTHAFYHNGNAYHYGDVGIGTSTPAAKLHVIGSGLFSTTLRVNQLIYALGGIQIGNTTDIGWYIGNNRITAGLNIARGVNVGTLLVSNAWADYTKVPTNGIYSKGNVEVTGTIHSSTGIWSSGWLSFSDLSSTSDRRFKDGVAPLAGMDALAVIRALKPSTWTWNALSKVRGRSAGFVAQDVAGVLPDAIREIGEDKHLALNYQMLHAYEVAALQEHDDEIGRLRTRVAELERQLKEARTWQH